MSVSRCLGQAVAALGGVPREEWKAYLDALPETCPHPDCTTKLGCRGYVAEYFRMQWRIRGAQEQVRQRQALRGGVASHG